MLKNAKNLSMTDNQKVLKLREMFEQKFENGAENGFKTEDMIDCMNFEQISKACIQ